MYHYADEKKITRVPNKSSIDSTKIFDRAEMLSELEWKFAHKSVKRNQKKIVLSKTTNNIKTKESESSLSSSQNDTSFVPLY